jgi:hypothetical protein
VDEANQRSMEPVRFFVSCARPFELTSGATILEIVAPVSRWFEEHDRADNHDATEREPLDPRRHVTIRSLSR